MIFRLDSPVWRRLLLFVSVALVCAALGMAGCARRTAPTTAARTGPAAPPRVTDTGAKPSEAESQEFAKELIAAVESNDIDKFNGLVDWIALFDQVTGGIDVPPEWKRSFQSGFLSSLTKPGGLFAELAAVKKSGGSFTLRRVHEVLGRPRVLIRQLVADRGVNYLDFELARRPGGKVRATDFYVFLTGERFTKTLRAIYLPLAASQSRSIVEKLLTNENEFVTAFPKIKEFSDAVRNGQPKEALAIYASLPAGARKEKSVMLLRLRAAQATDDESLYVAAMDDLGKAFPNDPCVDLISIDALVIHKEFDRAVAAIDRFDKSVGGDPYLKVLGSTVLIEQGKLDEAAKAAQAALDAEPTLREAHYVRLRVANGQKKFALMTKFLGEYEAAFNEELKEIEGDPEFAEFVASAEYKKYKAKTVQWRSHPGA